MLPCVIRRRKNRPWPANRTFPCVCALVRTAPPSFHSVSTFSNPQLPQGKRHLVERSLSFQSIFPLSQLGLLGHSGCGYISLAIEGSLFPFFLRRTPPPRIKLDCLLPSRNFSNAHFFFPGELSSFLFLLRRPARSRFSSSLSPGDEGTSIFAKRHRAPCLYSLISPRCRVQNVCAPPFFPSRTGRIPSHFFSTGYGTLNPFPFFLFSPAISQVVESLR